MNLYVNYGYSSTQGTYSACRVYGSHFDVEKAVAVNYKNTINGWKTIGIFVLNPDNPSATESITVERNDATTYSDTQYLAQCMVPYGDIYMLSMPVYDLGGVGNGPVAVGLDILDVTFYQDFGQTNDAILAAVREYFDRPSVPYMDISVYSKNNIVTIEWDNIDNIPGGLYPSSYTMVFNVRDSQHGWNFLASMPYNSDPKQYKFGYTEALNVMTPEARQQAMADHILNVDVSFGVTDPDVADYPHIDIVNGAWFTVDMSDNSVSGNK